MHRLVRMTVFASSARGLGHLFRDAWNTPVEVPVDDPGTFDSGLSPQRQGGGFERVSKTENLIRVLTLVRRNPDSVVDRYRWQRESPS